MTIPPRFPLFRCRGAAFSLPPEYERLRDQGPPAQVSFLDGSPVWVVTRRAEARQVLIDLRFSTDPSTPGHPSRLRGLGWEQAGQFLDMDPPEHDRYRRMVIRDFNVKRIPQIQGIVDELIDDMLRGARATWPRRSGCPSPPW